MKKIVAGLLSVGLCFSLIGCGTSSSVEDNFSVEDSSSVESVPITLSIQDYPDRRIVANALDWYNFSVDEAFDEDWTVYRVSGTSQVLEASKICSIKVGDNIFIITDGKTSKMVNIYRQHMCSISTRDSNIQIDNLIEENSVYNLTWVNNNKYFRIAGCTIKEKDFSTDRTVNTYTIFENGTEITIKYNMSIDPIYEELLDSTITLDLGDGQTSSGKTSISWKYYSVSKDLVYVFYPRTLTTSGIIPTVYKNGISVQILSFNFNEQVILRYNLDKNRYELADGIDIHDYIGKTLYAVYAE